MWSPRGGRFNTQKQKAGIFFDITSRPMVEARNLGATFDTRQKPHAMRCKLQYEMRACCSASDEAKRGKKRTTRNLKLIRRDQNCRNPTCLLPSSPVFNKMLHNTHERLCPRPMIDVLT